MQQSYWGRGVCQGYRISTLACCRAARICICGYGRYFADIRNSHGYG